MIIQHRSETPYVYIYSFCTRRRIWQLINSNRKISRLLVFNPLIMICNYCWYVLYLIDNDSDVNTYTNWLLIKGYFRVYLGLALFRVICIKIELKTFGLYCDSYMRRNKKMNYRLFRNHLSRNWREVGGGARVFSWPVISNYSCFVIWRKNIPWIVINMRAVNREELKGLARVLNLPIFYPNLWMFTFKTRPKFNTNVKKMNKFASCGCLSWGFFVSS
jgi:hypothetical protein